MSRVGLTTAGGIARSMSESADDSTLCHRTRAQATVVKLGARCLSTCSFLFPAASVACVGEENGRDGPYEFSCSVTDPPS